MADQRISGWAGFGATVKGARQEQGLTQAQLVTKAQVSRAWLAKFESGHRGAEFEQIWRVLLALDLSLFVRPTVHDERDLALRQALENKRDQRQDAARHSSSTATHVFQ